jgi:hypothetical protein
MLKIKEKNGKMLFSKVIPKVKSTQLFVHNERLTNLYQISNWLKNHFQFFSMQLK